MTPERKLAGVIVYVLKPVASNLNSSNIRQVLFLKRSGGRHADGWWPVAGTPEQGESARETALRELQEETGLVPTELMNFGMEIPHADPGCRMETFVALVDENSEVQLNYEHSEYRWLTGDEAVAILPDHSNVYLSHLRDQFMSPDSVVSTR